jgi:hypothetical protein
MHISCSLHRNSNYTTSYHSLGFLAQFETSRSEESMKLRRNQYCPIHRSRSCCGPRIGPEGKGGSDALACNASKTRTTPGDIANSAPKQRCGRYLIERLSNRTGNAPSVRWPSPTTTTSFLTTLIPEAWEVRGETTIRRTFRQCTSGVTAKRDPQGSTSDCRSAFLSCAI